MRIAYQENWEEPSDTWYEPRRYKFNENFSSLGTVSLRHSRPDPVPPLFSCALVGSLSHDRFEISPFWPRNISLEPLHRSVDHFRNRICVIQGYFPALQLAGNKRKREFLPVVRSQADAAWTGFREIGRNSGFPGRISKMKGISAGESLFLILADQKFCMKNRISRRQELRFFHWRLFDHIKGAKRMPRENQL